MYDFSFLARYDAQLVELASQAEAYASSDPSASLVKARVFAEVLAKIVGLEKNIQRGDNETADEFLSRLGSAGLLPPEQLKIFHQIRMAGNQAAHENAGTRVQSLLVLRQAHELALWFYKTKTGKPLSATSQKRSATETKSVADELAEKIRKGQNTDPPVPKPSIPLPSPLVLPKILKGLLGLSLVAVLLIFGARPLQNWLSTKEQKSADVTPVARVAPPAIESNEPSSMGSVIDTDEICRVALAAAQNIGVIPASASIDGAKQQVDGARYVCSGGTNPVYSIEFGSSCSAAPTADCITVYTVMNTSTGESLYKASDQTTVADSTPPNSGASSSPDASSGTEPTTVVLGPDNSKEIWTTSVYSYAPGGGGPGGGLDNDQLRVGGWGDQYWSLLQFDLPSGAKRALRVTLELYNGQSNVAGAPFDVYAIDEQWGWRNGDRLWWSNRPTLMHKLSSSDAPNPNSWVSIDITDIYNAWQAGERQNFGIALLPQSTNNNFDDFRSSKFADESYRPRVVIVPASAPTAVVSRPERDMLSHGTERLRQTYLFDFEQSVEPRAVQEADIWLESEDGSRERTTLEPENGARIAVVANGYFDFGTCAESSLSDTAISLSAVTDGTYICMRTRNGHVGEFRIDEISGNGHTPPYVVAMDYQVWN